ncbi:hydrolase [Maribacter halichondriae]|uniref:hydrolase n=1 Tax=Maribacter halichondriae TaxID=2980554 RepID=UPI00235A1BBE|nr:hydrolase [Maribacter sp. Hal144]
MKERNEDSTVIKQRNEECCPTFNLEKWDEKTHHWDHKKFIKASVPTLFHIPLPPMIGNQVTKMMRLAEDSNNLAADREDILLLFSDPSAFKSDLHLSVENTVPEAENTTLSGTYVSKVYDGPFNSVPKFIKKMDSYLKKHQQKANRYYVHYAYCPKCAKREGHNYMVLFAELEG